MKQIILCDQHFLISFIECYLSIVVINSCQMEFYLKSLFLYRCLVEDCPCLLLVVSEFYGSYWGFWFIWRWFHTGHRYASNFILMHVNIPFFMHYLLKMLYFFRVCLAVLSKIYIYYYVLLISYEYFLIYKHMVFMN